jgi:hypothetical protein
VSWVATFLIAALGGGVGAVLGLMIYGVLRVSGQCSEEEEAFQAGYEAGKASGDQCRGEKDGKRA